ncbi:MAG: Mrp/NBP35 family ATP-binding protein [Flavobacteriales bacterium]|nr:Mrp/NBP35 family ATP-binding protein [Flavobacteriales bacterium]MDG1779370.1 Mrp/NBP35 family ATP-binding protein [Flavobacteriales bacterium]MDG2245163.1 Mrp/NBP35 family ATP-binding protein [Flavobacteriales bacterium]
MEQQVVNRENVLEALSKVMEPDLKKDIISLNLVDELKVSETKISFSVKVSNPAMHSRKRMEDACAFALERTFGDHIDVEVTAVALPKEEQTNETRRTLPGVKHIIAVASGKGGVGKSTVAANLAAGLAQQGFTVGFVDADIYGPSAPTMFDLAHDKPRAVEIDGKQYIEPLRAYGVKILSIGFFADASQAIVWRGAMATKALTQLFNDAYWGDLDYMIVDLPPGTGDIHLSLVQTVPLTGAVIVSTPQEVALADAKKGVSMFQLDSINVPVLGLIENMSYFTPPELPNNKYHIFGRDGARLLAENLNIPFLGELPIVQSIREAADVGRPAVLQEGTIAAEAFNNIIGNFVKQVNVRVATKPATQTVDVKMQYPES